MGEKVKVSREVANFIERYETNVDRTPGWKDHLIFEHSRAWVGNFDDVTEDALCMSEISPLELAEILVVGYEIEETPEDRILETYNSCIRPNINFPPQKNHVQGFASGIEFVLKELGIKIKGIND